MTWLDVHDVVRELPTDRPVFHSEADFQHALAWRIHPDYPEARIRIETRPKRGVRLDVLADLDGNPVAIELKYLVADLAAVVLGEMYSLPNQA